ncbi:AmpG family muropeptide MFS transporter [Marinobacterium sediminicola]|uniref:MFS transporter, PAT family, beta-lactamase induction signal transducer AmpG n=1 Tax=Marinobacterium sediminicola TaxID=518898 RepID=A0ABY1RY24_9GAMM|nr:MFS transporter [Marinobacterium sediminicola]ULG68653.1 MFS transporter [Marinobacterium sediminicola]SMR73176.1 MFS transporter, PAT family, beta-lactamase induction signal transducer AmpG [Marinobacterium sediminicola]
MLHAWKETFARYRDVRLLWIFLMGCCSGFPFLLTGSVLSGWLTDAGVARAEVGLLGSVATVYAINFLWAPLVDRVHLPLLGRLGQRRSWILLTQLMMLIFTLLLATVNPASHLLMAGLFAFGIAASSATQDIAVDAYRIDQFAPHEKASLPPAAAIAIIGWWTGYSWPGYLAFAQADQLGWNNIYLLMAGVILLLMLFTLLVREPVTAREQLQAQAERQYQRELHGKHWITWFAVTVFEPFAEFFRKNGIKVALMLMLFIFLFKIGEAFLGRMSVVFYKEVGFTNEQIGEYTKLFGWFITVSFTLLGSAFNTRFGVVKGLLLGGSAMAASNLMFAVIAAAGPLEWLLLMTLVVDNFTTAFSTVAFVSFLTLLTGRAFSATQYALLASLGNLSRTTLAGLSGYTVDWLGSWERFFIVTALMVLPSLIMLWMLRERFNGLSASDIK